MSAKKKNKQYDYDYEWNGNASPVKGVNLAEKHPFEKPSFAAGIVRQESPSTANSRALEQKPTNWQHLQDQHQWQTPEWATMKNKSKSHHATIIKDPVPKPMLKKKDTAGAGGGSSKSSGPGGAVSDAEAEIIEMERLIEATKKKKEAMQAQKKAEEESAAQQEAERQKHTANETALERARREAKEREEARWRATLQERNARDKEKREQARLEALNANKARDDTSWQTAKSEAKPDAVQKNVPIISSAAAATPKPAVVHEQPRPASKSQQPMVHVEPVAKHPHHKSLAEEDYGEEEYEEEIIEEEEYVEEEYYEEADEAAELQRQIDALRQQLASA